MKTRSILTGSVFTLLAVIPCAKAQDSIGLNFVGSNNNTSDVLAPTQSAGVVPQINWNDLIGSNTSSTTDGVTIVDSTGVGTTVTASWTNGANNYDNSSTSGIAPLTSNANQVLNNGGIWGATGRAPAPTVTISNIPFASYEVIVTSLVDHGGTIIKTTMNSPTSGLSTVYADQTQNPGATGYIDGTSAPFTYTQSTDTTGVGTLGGDYALFTGLSGSSFTISEDIVSGSSSAANLSSIEIVNTGVVASGLAWSGQVNSTWDINTTANFSGQNFTNGSATSFGDTYTIGITTTPVTNSNINIVSGGVSPTTMAMSNSTVAYSFNGAITGGTILSLNGTGTTTLGGPVSAGPATDATDNTGLVAVVSSGTLILNKASSPTVSAVYGLTIGASGIVQLAGSGGSQIASTATVTVGGILDLNGRNATFDILSGTGTVTNNTATAGANSVLTIGAANDTGTFSGVIQNGANGTVALTKVGTGSETFTASQTYTGGTTINGGSLILNAGGQTGTLAANSNVIVNSGGTLAANTGDAFGYNAGALNLTVNEGGTISVTGANRATISNPVTLTGGTMTSTGVGDGNGSYSLLTPAMNATSAADGTPSVISAPLISLQSTTGTIFNVAKGGGAIDLKVSSTIADFPGNAGSITKNGNGVLNLTGAGSTFSGGTTVNQGTLAFAVGSAFGTGPITLAGGTVRAQGNAPVIGIKFQGGNGGNGPAVIGVEGVVPAGNWNNVTGQSGGPISLTDSTGVSSGASLASFTSTNTWATGSSDPLLNGYLDHTTNNPGAQMVTVSGIPYASYNVITYFGSDGAARGGSVNIGATTYYYNTLGPTTSYIQATDTDSTTQATAPQADYAIFNGVTGGAFTIDEEVTANNGLFGIQIVSTQLAGPTVANPVIVSGNSTIDVTGPNTATFTGAVTIGANTLTVTGGSTGANAPYTLNLGLGGGITLNGNATFSVANNGTGTGELLTGTINDNGGGFGITKTGNGTMLIQGPNSYAGATAVNEGALIVEGSLSGTSSVNVTGTVPNGSGGIVPAVLGGNATITPSGNVTIGAHGGLFPGAFGAPSTLDLELGTGSVTLGAQSNSDFLLTPTDTTPGAGINDLLTVTGTLTLGGTVLPMAFGGGSFGVGTWELASVTGTLSGSWTLDPTFLAAYPGSSITKSGDEVLLNVVAIPEPGAGMALFSGVAVFAGLRRVCRKDMGRN